MSDELLDLYNRELDYFRKLAGEFGDKHPKIAGRLRLSERVEDPHVSRLIEGFAYLNARVRLKIEDEFPELCEAILNVLYPEYLAPLPSCSIVQFELNKTQFELTEGYQIPRKSSLTTQEIEGQPCRFRTCYPVDLWPFSLASAQVSTPPFNVPPTSISQQSKGLVRLELKTYSDRVTFQQLPLDKLRVFLNGDTRYVYDLHELILNNSLGVVLATSDKDQKPVTLPASCLKPVGFARTETLIDYSPRTRLGYHLLTEFFSFPSKFLFFDLILPPDTLERLPATSNVCVYIFLQHIHRNLENLPASSFQLGATPAINLFEQRCEPIRVAATRSEFRVVPDARRPLANEVYSVNQVTLTSQQRQQLHLSPFFSANHHPTSERPAFWYAKRKKTEIAADQFNVSEDLGSDVFLNLVGLDSQNRSRDFDQWTLDVEATCFNRDIPNRLPVQTTMTLEAGNALASTKMLVHPTVTTRPDLRDELYWRLISHLSLNHLSLTNNDSNTESLKEIIRLYNFSRHRAGNAMLDGLVKMHARRIVGRVGGPLAGGFCKGTEIELILNEEKFSGGGHYLFASVLDRFFGLYASLNSFTQTVLRTQQQEQTICRWPPRSGESEHD
jgi:type VI secretion system protein ImpG